MRAAVAPSTPRRCLAVLGAAASVAVPDAYEALMDGRDQVVTGSRRNLVQTLVASVVPDRISALVARSQTKPGTASEDHLGVEDFATHRLPLDRAPEAYASFRAKEDGAIKVLFQP